MSRSFCVDFKYYVLNRSIGNNENVLYRNLSPLDLISILYDEGFQNFENNPVYVPIHGNDINGLREQVRLAVVGVPRNAYVSIRTLGGQSTKVLLTFTF